MKRKAILFVSAALLAGLSLNGQTSNSYSATENREVSLEVSITHDHGGPVNDLNEREVTFLDNKAVHSIKSLKLLATADAPGILPNYRITFDADVARHPKDFHRIEVRVARPNLKIETQRGYYALEK